MTKEEKKTGEMDEKERSSQLTSQIKRNAVSGRIEF